MRLFMLFDVFDDANIVHVDGSIDPLRDIETINLELIFADMEVLERRLSKQKRASYNNKDIAKECDFIERLYKHLEDGKLCKRILRLMGKKRKHF